MRWNIIWFCRCVCGNKQKRIHKTAKRFLYFFSSLSLPLSLWNGQRDFNIYVYMSTIIGHHIARYVAMWMHITVVYNITGVAAGPVVLLLFAAASLLLLPNGSRCWAQYKNERLAQIVNWIFSTFIKIDFWWMLLVSGCPMPVLYVKMVVRFCRSTSFPSRHDFWASLRRVLSTYVVYMPAFAVRYVCIPSFRFASSTLRPPHQRRRFSFYLRLFGAGAGAGEPVNRLGLWYWMLLWTSLNQY